MNVQIQLRTCADFWREIVVPDHEESGADLANLRRALHSAITLFHVHDWVFTEHRAKVCQAFSIDPIVRKAARFADELEKINPDFALIRSVANATKHLGLDGQRRVPNAANNAANTVVGTTGYGEGGYGKGPYGGGPRVILEGSGGAILEFSDISQSVRKMWEDLNRQQKWW